MTEDDKKRDARFYKLWDEIKGTRGYDANEWKELEVHLRAAQKQEHVAGQEHVIQVAESVHRTAMLSGMAFGGAGDSPSTAPEKVSVRLSHVGGSSRPCEVVELVEKPIRGKRAIKTTLRVRWGSAGIYDVDPITGKVAKLEAWSADPSECRSAIEAWKARRP
jgi:hypothetical protein